MRSPADADLHWDDIAAALDADGYALTPAPVVEPDQCRELVEGFDRDHLFRSTVDMAGHRFGEGVYRYYAYPLPPVVATLREATYGGLASIANRWSERLGEPSVYPDRHDELVRLCHDRGQTRPTPLILRYERRGWNALHQDLYGEIAFPLQITIALTRPGVDFQGGENLFVEQRPRAQSRGTAVTVPLGHAVIFPTRYRPMAGSRGCTGRPCAMGSVR